MFPGYRCLSGGRVGSVFRPVQGAAIASYRAVSLAVLVVCCGKLLSAYRHGAIMGSNRLQIQLWSRWSFVSSPQMPCVLELRRGAVDGYVIKSSLMQLLWKLVTYNILGMLLGVGFVQFGNGLDQD
ncbi:hypothetical protein OUZ56_020526 [Daphnia magna]|uniref:Uncharacterized protein n=1 Tax=Daphnia magna TaxID=35525 RepID=A0ABQ9ZG74_9CRUS|nr:hypothetical protein OUZ56_020526 [Daphnia magna]